VMTYPNEQLPAGRPLKKAPAYDAMNAAGAVWGCSWGLEIPLAFAPKDFEETPTLKRSNAFPIVAEECRAVREDVGLLDTSGFSRFEARGPNVEAWLDRIMAGLLPAPGRIRLAPMLAPDGRLKGDLTIFNWGDGTWWIMGSYYLRQWHMRWFRDHLEAGVSIDDISDGTVGFSLSGPKSREVMASLTHQDVSHDALAFMSCATLDVGLIRAKVGRLSVAGELGYEINCSAMEHIALREMLLEAGAPHGIREYGYYALNALRLEKSFGIWSAEFTQGYTPGMTGMDRWIGWDKGDFTGRDAAIAERDGDTASQKLVTLEIDAEDADASGFEPVWKDGKRVGFITSGGYGHVVQKSLAMALVDPGHAKPGVPLTTHIVGVERAARVIEPSPYDPKGTAMRR
ncbi:MAG: aminomethyltransferase family protein, partial [Geminicoccaceae bacterium]